ARREAGTAPGARRAPPTTGRTRGQATLPSLIAFPPPAFAVTRNARMARAMTIAPPIRTKRLGLLRCDLPSGSPAPAGRVARIAHPARATRTAPAAPTNPPTLGRASLS